MKHTKSKGQTSLRRWKAPENLERAVGLVGTEGSRLPTDLECQAGALVGITACSQAKQTAESPSCGEQFTAQGQTCGDDEGSLVKHTQELSALTLGWWRAA